METAPTPPPPNPVPGAGRLLTKRPATGRQTPAAARPRPAIVSLSWEHEDIENRWGLFKGGRFTSVNKIFTFLIALGISAAFVGLNFFLVCHYPEQSSLHKLVNYIPRPDNLFASVPATLFFFWGVVVSLVKLPKLH